MVMLKIAEVMNCNAGDMMDFIPDDKNTPVEEDAKLQERQECYAIR